MEQLLAIIGAQTVKIWLMEQGGPEHPAQPSMPIEACTCNSKCACERPAFPDGCGA